MRIQLASMSNRPLGQKITQSHSEAVNRARASSQLATEEFTKLRHKADILALQQECVHCLLHSKRHSKAHQTMSTRVLLASLAAVAHGLVTPARPSRLAPLAAYNKWTDSYDTNKLKGAASKFVNKDGRLYAPWLEQQVDDAATARSRSEREQRTKQKYAKAAADGLIGMSIEGASAELGGGGLRMNAKLIETPATAEEHGHVQLS